MSGRALMRRTGSAGTFGIAGICAIAVWLALSIVLALLAIGGPVNLPWDLNEHLFFAPQFLFSFKYIVKRVAYSFVPLFSPAGAWVFGVVLWSAVAAGYGWLTRRLSIFAIYLFAPVVIIAIAILVHSVFGAMGYGVQLDGP